jgi:hypothetical protein
MIQVLKEYREPSTSERFGQAFAGLGNYAANAIPQYLKQKQERQEHNQNLDKENEAAKKLGIDLTVTNDPKMRQELLATALKGKYEKQKTLEDEFLENQSFGHIKKTFGEKFANIWKAAPTGGKTELLKHGIDAVLRGDNLEEMLEGVEPPEIPANNDEITIPQLKNGKLPKEFEWPDYSKRPAGYTPKDWSEQRKTWRSENSPIYLENKKKLAANSKDELGIKNLKKINKSEKLPEGFEKLIINPETGEIYGAAQIAGLASKEAQEWVKETARFQNRAKDTFGSRVTNFDLVSYMKQFPSLLNTTEGRERILNMLAINNKLDTIYDKALEKIYQKYGLNGIPQEEADKLAQKMIEEETKKLYDEYLEINDKNEMETSDNLSGIMIDLIGPDGQTYEIDQRQIDKLPEGFKVI